MMRRTISSTFARLFSMTIVISFVGSAFLGVLFMIPEGADAQTTGKITKTVEGWESMDMSWSPMATTPGEALTMNLSIMNGFEVDAASVKVTSEPILVDPFENKWEYPTNPSLTIGLLPTWEFPGTMGAQMEFANGSDEEEKVFTAGDNEQYLYIPLPLNANLKSSKFDVINTQTTPYEYTMTIGSNQVWYRNSIGFSKTNTIETEFGVNDVTVMNIDPNYDPNLDLVGVGEVGYMYVVKHSDTEPSGYSPPMKFESSIERKELTSLCVGDYDYDFDPDLVATNMKGTVFAWKNDGMNLVQTPESYAVADNKLLSCTLGDLNNDGMLDVASGYLTGTVYYMDYNPNKVAFDPANVVTGGSGAMNSLRIFDMDGDGFQDIVGGNGDTSFIFIRNTPKGTFEQGKPTASGGESLNSIDVADLNGDGWADMVGASNDGSIYIAYSSGPGVFDPGVEKKASTSPMTRLILEDMDLDNDPDILTYSQDGFIYLIQNNYNFLGTPVQLLNVGPSVRGMSVGDLDGDMDKDLVLATGKGFEIWRNDFGPFEDQVSGPLNGYLQQYLDNCELHAEACSLSVEENGVKITEVPVKVRASRDGVLRFLNVSIAYDLTTTIDIKENLVNYMRKSQFSAVSEIPVPLNFRSDSFGTLKVNGISIQFTETFVALIDSPKFQETYLVNQTIKFHAFSNKDPSGSATYFNYTWTVVGDINPFAYGNDDIELPVSKVTSNFGTVTIRVNILNQRTGEKDGAEVPIVIEDVDRPQLKLTMDKSNLQRIKDGQDVTVKATVENVGLVDCTNIIVTFAVDNTIRDQKTVAFVGNKNNQSLSKQVVEFQWSASPGKHKLAVSMMGGNPEPVYIQNPDNFVVETTSTPPNYFPYFLMVVVIAVGSVVGFMALKKKQEMDEENFRKEREEYKKQLETQAAQEFATLYGQDMAATGKDYGGAGAAADAAMAADYAIKCPRCGGPSLEHGTQCFNCDTRDSVTFAENAIKEVRDLGIEIDEAEELLKKSKKSIEGGFFEEALEEAELAEDLATEMKERYEKAFAVLGPAEGEESAAERRKKRLERRKAARVKRAGRKGKDGEAAEGEDEEEGEEAEEKKDAGTPPSTPAPTPPAQK